MGFCTRDCLGFFKVQLGRDAERMLHFVLVAYIYIMLECKIFQIWILLKTRCNRNAMYKTPITITVQNICLRWAS